ncbi:baculovirus repeated ORF c [Orgyia leucostigma nucleopolyhedrovirus]|uniref:Baculovirus repeated ORF c n=1 Tax=Orgyia leucostigma nucleopolyhedrovirus TaxID=490711 RepID=B0FDR7_9ABAC|nr:baculovirus repeated ORF c [Orgyia leucostigma nucleopolyhedrovirus]ABY65775.1 baculovirus repeated ORF c [Orgyia leucostigma nucleopolyhedrovirus]
MSVVKVQFANADLEVISVRDNDGQVWMLANPFARVLEYSNAPKAITTFVDHDNQKYFEEIKSSQVGQTCVVTSSCVQAKSKFINRAGLFELIQASRMPKAKEFRDWINSDLLPKLCDEGRYDMAVDAPIKIANGMNAMHAITNDGKDAPWMEDLRQLRNSVVQKDKIIEAISYENKELSLSLRTSNEKLMYFASALVDSNNGLIKANERIENLANRMADIAQDVIAKPSDPQLLHSLAVCSMGGDQYAFLRPQRKSLKRSLNRLSMDEQNIVFKSDYVPNAVNILNKVKENLPKDKYKAKHNKITLLDNLTKDDLVEAINSSLTQRQVAIIAKKAYISNNNIN